MPESFDIIELELTPIPPDTTASGKEDITRIIEEALRRAGKEAVINGDQIQVEVEKTFPTDAVIIITITLLSKIALETYKEIVLPELKRRFEVRHKTKHNQRQDDADNT